MSRHALSHASHHKPAAGDVGVLQRKCACGTHTVAGGRCSQCAQATTLRRPLTIGANDDPAEQEADRVAGTIVGPAAHQLGCDFSRVKVRWSAAPTVGRYPTAAARVLRRQPRASTSYREDLERTEQAAHEESVQKCAGVTTLMKLEKSRDPLTPREEVERLERRLKSLPKVLGQRAEKASQITMVLPVITEHLKEQARVWGPLGRPDAVKPSARVRALEEQLKLSKQLYDWDKAVIEPEFGSGYVLGSLDQERARAECRLSRARWEFLVFMRTGRRPERRLMK
jgi:hypothetical protein